MKNYFVYVLLSEKDKELYIGFTHNLARRVAEHNSGKSPSTKARVPLLLIFYECYFSIKDAKRREQYFKTTYGKKALKLMLRETMVELGYRHMDRERP